MPSLSRSPRRAAGRALSLALLGLGLVLAASTPAHAEDAKDAKPAAKADPAPAAKADAPGRRRTGRRRAKAPKSMLQWAIEASGPIGFFLLVLSIYFTAMVIRLFMEFSVSEAVPPALDRQAGGGDQGRSSRTPTTPAATTTRSWPSSSAPAIANLPNGRAEAKEAMNETLQRGRRDMEAGSATWPPSAPSAR